MSHPGLATSTKFPFVMYDRLNNLAFFSNSCAEYYQEPLEGVDMSILLCGCMHEILSRVANSKIIISFALHMQGHRHLNVLVQAMEFHAY
jgi:hypothetical protein